MSVKGTSVLDGILTKEQYIDKKINKVTDEFIAFEFSVGMSTLDSWKKKSNIKRYDVNKKRYYLILDMKKQDMSYSEISRKLHITPRQIHNIISHFKEKEVDTY